MLRNLLLCTAVLLAAIAAIASGASSGAPYAQRVLTGSINQVNKGWLCQSAVNLDSVTVTMNQSGGPLPTRGANNDDAVHLGNGCTGSIGKITIVQYRGDGIKVGSGAHDLTIGGGSIRCLAHDPGKHQDGIQVMGGQRVTFSGIDDQCQSANNSAFFVNRGTMSQESPTDVVCAGCYLQGGGITVRIDTSVRSGVSDSTVVAGRLSAARISKTSAVNPVWIANSIVAFGSSGQSGSPGTGAGTGPRGAPSVKVASVAGQALRLPLAIHRLATIGVVQTSLQVDRPVVLRVSALAGRNPSTSNALLPLLKASRIGKSISGQLHTTLIGRGTPEQSVALVLRIPLRSLHAGVPYNIRVIATDSAGRPATLLIAVR
jgi:hypothetical protein